MRLKTFSASSMSDALKMVKEHFGEEAIIVSSQKAEIGLGVQVTAAVDTETEPPTKFNNDVSNRPSDIDEKLSSILSGQGVLPKIIDEILNVCSTLGLDDIYTSLASSIDQIINFKTLPKANEHETFMLVGLPGAGKTVTTAKLATKAVMKGSKINVISTDNVRAGGIQQLEAFTKIFKTSSIFVSRGDNSGTHFREMSIWKKSKLSPSKYSGDWYREVGSGMGATLNIASGMGGYPLTDRASWVNLNYKSDLKIAAEKNKLFLNHYGITMVNPGKCPNTNTDDAKKFIEWLISPKGQVTIGNFKVNGQQLFFPNSKAIY